MASQTVAYLYTGTYTNRGWGYCGNTASTADPSILFSQTLASYDMFDGNISACKALCDTVSTPVCIGYSAAAPSNSVSSAEGASNYILYGLYGYSGAGDFQTHYTDSGVNPVNMSYTDSAASGAFASGTNYGGGTCFSKDDLGSISGDSHVLSIFGCKSEAPVGTESERMSISYSKASKYRIYQ